MVLYCMYIIVIITILGILCVYFVLLLCLLPGSTIEPMLLQISFSRLVHHMCHTGGCGFITFGAVMTKYISPF